MPSHLLSSVRLLTICFLIVTFAVPTGLFAQTHVVNPADLQKEMVTASQARQHHAETIQRFLSSEKAEKALKSARIDPAQVKTAVSMLSNDELSQLASRADKAQADFAAGDLSERDLLLIIIAIAVLVLIIVAVR
jgi:hypothetical protein